MSEPIIEYGEGCPFTITMNQILDTFSKKSEEKRLKDIKADIIKSLFSSPDCLFDSQRVDVEAQIESIVRADKKLGDASLLVYSKGKYKQRRTKMLPGGADVALQSNDFTGRAGECAVMSELLFRGYNVNRMMVDGGIDLVAFKDGAYFFYQVKTVSLKNGTIQASIPIDNYDKNRGYASQMRYVIVARYKGNNVAMMNHIFVFSQNDIDREMHDRCMKRGSERISIKIKFHELTGLPMLYDEREHEADWYYYRF